MQRFDQQDSNAARQALNARCAMHAHAVSPSQVREFMARSRRDYPQMLLQASAMGNSRAAKMQKKKWRGGRYVAPRIRRRMWTALNAKGGWNAKGKLGMQSAAWNAKWRFVDMRTIDMRILAVGDRQKCIEGMPIICGS